MEVQNLEDEAASLFLGPLRHFRHGTPVRCKCVSDKTNASIPGSPMSGGLPTLLCHLHWLVAVAVDATMCSCSPRPQAARSRGDIIAYDFIFRIEIIKLN